MARRSVYGKVAAILTASTPEATGLRLWALERDQQDGRGPVRVAELKELVGWLGSRSVGVLASPPGGVRTQASRQPKRKAKRKAVKS